ncbi:MAG: AraC family transcriptional regulator [Oscillospiraceae bacterium]|nr:AraC family transcriptional regulator [Oscillospiraceae bacterium]
MELRIGKHRMEDVEDLRSEYPYAYHHVDLRKTLVPWHWHEALELGYVLEGSVKVSTAEGTEIFHAGEGFFVNSNVLTAMDSEDGCIMDSHLFHPIFLAGHFKSIFETKYMAPVLHNRSLDLLPIRGQTDTERQLLSRLRELAALQSQPDGEFHTRNTLSLIWLCLLQVLSSTQLRRLPAKNQDRMLPMLTYIQEHFAEKITLEQIAAAACISTRECLRCFRSCIQQSPMEYLTQYRIEAASRLLEKTTLPVTEIAMETGWGSSAYFSKIFRKLRGMSPKEYRAQAQ